MHSKTDLGRWVSYQRTARSLQVKVLTERRIELLDQLGFSWSGRPEGWTPPPPSGDPIQNRAMAAKIMYPDLTMREALLLGGLEEEEMNVVRNPNNAWRTGESFHLEWFVDNFLHIKLTICFLYRDASLCLLQGSNLVEA